jgi:hypothetical protein
LCKYFCGGQVGNIVFAWRLPEGEIDQTQQFQTINTVKKMVPQYESQAAAKDIRDRLFYTFLN